MQFRQLRRILQQIVVAGLPVMASGCIIDDAVGGDDDCVDLVKRTLHVSEPAAPPMQLRIDSCRADADACGDLCVMAMQDADLGASTPKSCAVEFADDVVVKVTYEVYTGGSNCPVDGRRPAGLATPSHLPARSAAGAWLAQAAWLEAASVHAFVHLARELELHGAPRALVKLAVAAAKDEVRHTTMMTYLANRYGAEPPAVDVVLPGLRSLEALAIENAAEGCVRETWGAVVALWQSHVAPDPEVRETMAAIAKDEARHAALAWAVDAWVQPQLDDAARARVAEARERAARELLEGGEIEALVAIGLPNAREARGLLVRTYNSLWMGGLS